MTLMLTKELKTGFTIVELLIVVVVIAILAAITVVSYNGITNKAHDSAVQNDLATLKKKSEMFFVEKGYYPNSSTLTQLGFKAATSSYMVSTSRAAFNLSHCRNGVSTVTVDEYAVVAMSKSGKKYSVGSKSGVMEVQNNWTSATTSNTLCAELLPSHVDNYNGWLGTDTVTGPWRAWAI